MDTKRTDEQPRADDESDMVARIVEAKRSASHRASDIAATIALMAGKPKAPKAQKKAHSYRRESERVIRRVLSSGRTLGDASERDVFSRAVAAQDAEIRFFDAKVRLAPGGLNPSVLENIRIHAELDAMNAQIRHLSTVIQAQQAEREAAEAREEDEETRKVRAYLNGPIALSETTEARDAAARLEALVAELGDAALTDEDVQEYLAELDAAAPTRH